MKIIFVGIHNKYGMNPLDSKTASGKKIDAVIANFKYSNCIKANLFDLDFLPKYGEPDMWVEEFLKRVQVHTDDIVVCLGETVWKFLKGELICQLLKFYHPSPLCRNLNHGNYVSQLSDIINAALKLAASNYHEQGIRPIELHEQYKKGYRDGFDAGTKILKQ